MKVLIENICFGNQLQSQNNDNIDASGENSRKIFQEAERCVSTI